MKIYATTDDVIAYRGALDADTLGRLEPVLRTVSAQFRVEASHYGKDLDSMIEESEDLEEVTKVLVIDATLNYINSTATNDAPLSQFSQAAGGYSISGTYFNPGGGLYSKKNWLKLLGVSRQKVGTLEVFSFDD